MREIVFDTETTGLDPDTGDRIVEIGAVELFNHVPTGRTFHEYLNPERAMPREAFEIHGLGDDFLRDKPCFRDRGAAFLDFVGDANLVAHNAAFDIKFVNAELTWIKLTAFPLSRAVDTAEMARRRFPGSPVSLDALCRRFGIDNSARTLHGALLDAEILAEVYLELVGGRQPIFALGGERREADAAARDWRPRPRPRPLAPRVTDEERAAHGRMVEGLGEGAVWRALS